MRRLAAVLAGLTALLGAVPQARADAVAFQANPAHTGDAGDPGLRLPLRRAWSARLPGHLSFPVVADGRVFVVRDPPNPNAGPEVVALSVASGAVRWRVALGAEAADAGLGYGGGRLVVARESYFDDHSAVLALDPADGRVLWEAGTGLWEGHPPVVAGDTVYVKGMPGSSVTALKLADGAPSWTTPTDSGDSGSVAVDGDAVYAEQSGCPDVHRFRAADGVELWNTENGCHGAGGRTPVAHRGRLYTHTSLSDPTGAVTDVLDGATGTAVAQLALGGTPAFRGGLGIFPVPGRGNVSGYRITARELATGRPRWRFSGDGYLDSAPLIASGLVFLGSGSGRVYGVRLRSGRRVWRVGLRSPVPAAGFGTAGLAAAERTLFVPVVGRLHAFR